ncbi:hypothetical protein TVAG_076330 [Trichomonas vaginalis G3]|uniref:t-SNARE coiled-coil homology domain-containing protein n=1 Tax=Trichomonas vaginalis (strain ATCC PRA-98 / G3) TaxID=412133 RepID=A2D9N0_TRIV3|nr:syntaxin-18 family [Trichomonas vaginalis G3]EAY22886.1 hypothetical protein TVAG_076330 [Trichomonas vaginalis G3]KAI5527398.1 syntaxin-18 family [Trichomonas vaginalis G3]|eukprot:XP_001583872.1 hypothetical protein [Trichomonas vaginalis G3]
MNRTVEFFTFLSKNQDDRDLNKLLKSRISNPFNEASETIANTIKSLLQSIQDTAPSFIDKYNSILSLSSSMDDEQREAFVKETEKSINKLEKLITELAENVNSGKMGLKGQAIDHSQGVFAYLDKNLNQARRDLQFLCVQREYVISKSRAAIPTLPVPVQNYNARSAKIMEISKPKKTVVAPGYERSLLQEHDNIVDELLDFNSELNVTDEQMGNIAMMVKSFNELITRQNQQIRIIKADVEKAQENYEESHHDINKTIDRTKFQHLWMAFVIIILGLMLLIKS